MNNVGLTIDETFNLAVKNHLESKTDIAQELYNQVLKIDPNHLFALNNLGIIFKELGQIQKAKNCYERAIRINPNYADALNNLGIIFKELGQIEKAKNCYEKAIRINPNYANALNNLGVVFGKLRDNQKAKDCYEKAIKINPNYADAHNNLGILFKELKNYQKAKDCSEKAIEINPNDARAYNSLGLIYETLGKYRKAKDCFEKAIKINPNYADAHSNLGGIFNNLVENQKAKNYYEKAIKINPDHVLAYWNLHGLSPDADAALLILKKLYKIDNKNTEATEAKIMISVLEAYKGNFSKFNDLLTTPDSNHAIARSAKWVFSLPKLPNIFFDRWDFFDNVIKLSDSSKPFYEFGVWNASSFQYLINTFKKGFGFDTFDGIPEDWHNEPKGAYSAFGTVPKIKGGEFIVGKFEDTLPKFFLKERPVASLINFDADLYSSTLCALKYSNKVIDEKTILIFDEFIVNSKWEQDEYKALNEFCENLGYNYEVIAISFFSKQVAVKLKKN